MGLVTVSYVQSVTAPPCNFLGLVVDAARCWTTPKPALPDRALAPKRCDKNCGAEMTTAFLTAGGFGAHSELPPIGGDRGKQSAIRPDLQHQTADARGTRR